MRRRGWLSLQVKLTLALLLPAVTVGISASYLQVHTIATTAASFASIIDSYSVQLDALQSINAQVLQLQVVTLGSPNVTNDVLRSQVNEIAGAIAQAESDFGSHAPAGSRAAAAALQKTAMADTDTLLQQARALTDTAHPLSATDRQAKITDFRNKRKDLTTLITQSESSARQQLTAEDKIVGHSVATTKRNLVVTVFLATLLAVCVGLIVAERLTQSVNRLKIAAQRVANGDFSEEVRVISHDEVGELAGTFNQMSARLKDSYQRLEIEKRRDEAIMQSMAEGLLAIDAGGRIVLINDVAARLVGLPDRQQAIGKPVQDAYQLYDQNDKTNIPLSPADRPALKVLKSGEVLSEVYQFHDAKGGKHLLGINAAPVKIDERVAGAIILMRDVTKEKEIDRMKTEFISLASHQLRTPLSAIKWFSEMLLSGDAGPLNADQQEFSKNIADSTERMIALVNALLNISRIESGRILVDPKPTDLKALVNGIVTDLKAKTEEKQQNMIISVHSDLPKINLDARMIGQVYLNLLTNAIKYTPKGGEISVFISRKDDQIISQVTDNGYGIPKEQQSRIFQKFFRAANAVKVETDGTGLGLYLIKSIVESSGGKIWFESEEGKGTTFWFSIPTSGMKARAGEVTLDV